MRAVYWKELREFAPVVLVLSVLAYLLSLGSDDPMEDLGMVLRFVLIGGVAVGAVHGVFDRSRRDDLFLLHRPVPSARLHLARGLAGATACLVPLAVFVACSSSWGPAPEVQPWDRVLEKIPRPLTPEAAILMATTVIAAWAAIRLALLPRRSWQALLLLISTIVAGLSLIARAETTGSAIALLCGIGFLCSLASSLVLMGESP